MAKISLIKFNVTWVKIELIDANWLLWEFGSKDTGFMGCVVRRCRYDRGLQAQASKTVGFCSTNLLYNLKYNIKQT